MSTTSTHNIIAGGYVPESQHNLFSHVFIVQRFCQVLESAGSIARAYAVGPKEAAAIHQLTTRVAPSVISLLKDAVRTRGMRGFLNHEAIGKEIFSEAWSSGSGPYEAWNDALTNRQDRKLVPC